MARDLAEVVDFGRYEPLFRIGLGGMAEVYAARIRGEAGFQKLVAVKRMLPHLTGDKKFVDMFLDEARLAANISSPHVVQTLDLGRADDDSLYIVMDLILGVTISQMLRHLAGSKQYVDPGISVELITQAAQGLDDAHEAVAPDGRPLSIVHRDISPQNILIGTDGRARVTDFGIAHAIMLRRTETQVGEMKGKFAYFSPEQALGKSLDRRSDIFALGIVAWELVTGRRLFRGKPLEQLEAVKRTEIPTPISVRNDLPQPVSDAIMQALARDPEDRFASAAAFAGALRRSAASLEEIPGPRVIGQFVREVGGERLERMRQCIANSGKLPSDVPKVTAIIEGTISGTHFIADNAESTHILDDEVSEIVHAQTTAEGKALPETAERGIPATEEQVLMAFASQVTTNKLPDGVDIDVAEMRTQPPLVVPPTRVKDVGSAPVIGSLTDGSLTIQEPPPDHADIHQAPTQQWMDAGQPVTGTTMVTTRRSILVGLGAGLLTLVIAGGAFIAFSGSGEAGEAGDEATSVTALPPETVAASETETEAETEAEAEAAAEAETETETEAAAETATETEAETEAETVVADAPPAKMTGRRSAAARAAAARRRREAARREAARREAARQQELRDQRNMSMGMGMSGIPDF